MSTKTKTGVQVGNELLAIAGPEYIKPEVQITGRDGNAFAIIGTVWTAVRKANQNISTFPKVEQKWKQATNMMNPELQSYDDLLQFCLTVADAY